MEKSKKKENTAIKNAVLAGLIAVAVTLLLTFLAAVLCSKEILTQGRGDIYERGILIAASLLAGLLACQNANSGKLLCAAESGGILFLFVIILAVADVTSSAINISLLIDFACIIFGVLAGCLLTARHKKYKKRRK